MAESPLVDQKTDLLKFEILIQGSPIPDDVLVVGIQVDKQLYHLSHARIELSDGDISSQEFFTIENKQYEPGKTVEIKLGYHNSAETVFKGIIVAHNVKIESEEAAKIILDCADKAICLTGQRKSAFHQNKKDSQLITDLINEGDGVATDVASTNFTHPTIIQHNSTNWDFINTRAQMNEMVVFADENKVIVKKPDLGSPKLTLEYGLDIIDMDLAVDARNQLKSVKATSWNPDSHTVESATSSEPSFDTSGNGSLKGSSISGSLGYQEHEIHSTSDLTTQELQSWAKSTLMLSRLSKMKGTIRIPGSSKVNPNECVEIKKIGKYYDNKVYVSGVSHEVKDGNWITDLQIGLDGDHFLNSNSDANHLPADGLFPAIQGLFIGVVKKIADPDGEFRVQLEVPLVEENGTGIWARMAQVYAGDNYGSFFIPHIGDEVICGALGGDMRHPVILGQLYSKKNKPHENEFPHNDDNYMRGWRTPQQLLFHFDDDKKIIRIETPGGQKARLDDDGKLIELEDQHGNKITMDNYGVTVDSSKDIILKASMGKIEMTGAQGIKGSASMGDVEMTGTNFNATGQMSAKVKGNMSASVEGGQAELKGTGMASVTAPLVKIN